MVSSFPIISKEGNLILKLFHFIITHCWHPNERKGFFYLLQLNISAFIKRCISHSLQTSCPPPGNPPLPTPGCCPLQGRAHLWRSQTRWTTEIPSSPGQLRDQVPESGKEWFPQGFAMLLLRSRRVPSSTEGFRWSIRSPRVWSSEMRVPGQPELPHRGHL